MSDLDKATAIATNGDYRTSGERLLLATRIAEAVADEREACAKVCEAKYQAVPGMSQTMLAQVHASKTLAAAIRGRGEK